MATQPVIEHKKIHAGRIRDISNSGIITSEE